MVRGGEVGEDEMVAAPAGRGAVPGWQWQAGVEAVGG